jgi:hypothetical protein
MNDAEDWVYPGPGNCDMCGHKEHEPSVCGVINGGTFEPEYCSCIDAFRADAELTRLAEIVATLTAELRLHIGRTCDDHDITSILSERGL